MGIGLSKWKTIKVGDIIQCTKEVVIKDRPHMDSIIFTDIDKFNFGEKDYYFSEG
jgi:hypothetical protein